MSWYCQFCSLTVTNVSRCHHGHKTVSNERSAGQKTGFYFGSKGDVATTVTIGIVRAHHPLLVQI